MGFISNLARSETAHSAKDIQSRQHWRRTFGTTKEDGPNPLVPKAPVRDPNSYTRSATSGDNATKHLLKALRSPAPSGWSDDRWEQSRHFVGIAYVAIHRICEQLMQAEFQVFKKDPMHPDGKRPVFRGEQGYELVELLEKPNPEDSFGDLMYGWSMQMDLTGQALTWMVPNRMGTPYELYPIPTALAIPQTVINADYPNGFYRIQPVYPYGPFSTAPTPYSAVGAAVPAEWMLKFKYPHPFLRHDGWSPLTALRHHLDQVESIDRSRNYSMKRSINPSAVLNMEDMDGSLPLPWEEIERIRAEYEADFYGPENHGRIYVSTPGAKLEQWGSRPVDMDYQNGWNQLVSFVLGGFGITKQAAGMLEDSSYSTLFATLKQLYWLTLDPKCYRFSTHLTKHLAPFFGDDLIVDIRCKRIDDHDVKNQRMQLLMAAQAITKNEFRKEMEMPLTRDIWGMDMAGTPSVPPYLLDPVTGLPIVLPDGTPLGPQQLPGAGGIVTGTQGMEQPPLVPTSGEHDDESRLVPAEISNERPKAKRPMQGAMGRRKESVNGHA
jgi:phage portal protein BeeE